MDVGNLTRKLVESAELPTADLSSFDEIGVTDDDGLSYVSLWTRERPLAAFSSAEARVQLSLQPAVLLIKVANADDRAIRMSLCDELSPLLAGRTGTVGAGWMDRSHRPKH